MQYIDKISLKRHLLVQLSFIELFVFVYNVIRKSRFETVKINI